MRQTDPQFRVSAWSDASANPGGGAKSVKVVLEIQTTAEHVDDVKQFFRSVLPDTRAFDGFESLTLHQNQDDPTSFLV